MMENGFIKSHVKKPPKQTKQGNKETKNCFCFVNKTHGLYQHLYLKVLHIDDNYDQLLVSH